MKFLRIALIPCLIGACSLPAISQDKRAVRRFDFQKYFIDEWKKEGGHKPRIEAINYWDVDGDGREEAVVVAWSNFSGKGGPDIHAVFKLDHEGKPVELEFDNPKMADPEVFAGLVGDRRSWFEFQNGVLMRVWEDTSGVQRPLILHFRWNGKKLGLIKIQKRPNAR